MPIDRSRSSREVQLILLGLTLVFGVMVASSWARWGDVLVDSGTAIDRAARVAAGQVLYRDVLSPYGPVATEVVAEAFRLFGTHLTTVYGVGIAVLFAEGLMLLFLGRHLVGIWESAFAVLMFWALLGVQPVLTSWIVPNTFASIFAAFAATATLLVAVSDAEHARPWKPLAASMLAALAGLAKVEFGVAAVGAVLLAVAISQRAPGERMRAVLFALVPGALVSIAVFAWLCWRVPFEQLVYDNLYRKRTLDLIVSATRSWGDVPLWPTVVGAAAHYAGELPARAAALAWGASQLRRGGWRRVSGALLCLAAIAIPLLPGYPQIREFLGLRNGLHYYWAATGWAVVGLIAAFSLLRNSSHLVFLVLGFDRADDPEPSFSRLAGGASARSRAIVVVAFFAVLLSLRWNLRIRLASYYSFLGPLLLLLTVREVASVLLRRRIPQWAVVAVFVLPFLAAQSVNVAAFQRRSTPVAYPRGTLFDVRRRAIPLSKVIDYVRSHTGKADFVAVIPEERIINFLAERRNPTRDSGIGPRYLANEEDERAYIGALESHATALVVVSGRQFPEFGYGGVGSYNPIVMEYLNRRYRKARRIGVGARAYTIFVPRH